MPTVKPMVVSIFFGEGKPDLNTFLKPFVDEMNEILKYGLAINEYQLNVSIFCFICDSPARSFLKGIYNTVNSKV